MRVSAVLYGLNQEIRLLTNTGLFILIQFHAERAGTLCLGQCEETKMAAIVVVVLTRIMAIQETTIYRLYAHQIWLIFEYL